MVEILDVKRLGEWYRVLGWYRGRKVSADVHAKEINGKPEPHAFRVFRRGVEMVGQAEDSGRIERA